MTVITGSDGLTYTIESGTLTITGSGAITALSAGSIDSTYSLNSLGVQHVIIGEGIISIPSSAFQSCSFLDCKLPSTLTTIGAYAFNDTESVTEWDIPASVTAINSFAFNSNVSVESIIFRGNQPTIGAYAFRLSGGGTSDHTYNATVYSNGWADSSDFPSEIIGDYTALTFVTGLPTTYKHTLFNGSKMQVDSAIRDEDGLRFKTKYAKKTDLDGKVDKITSGSNTIYGWNNATQQQNFSTSYGPSAGTIPIRDTPNGQLRTAITPTYNDACISKQYFEGQMANKQNALTFDSAPTANSTNPVTSGGVKTALNGKQDIFTTTTVNLNEVG